MCLRAADKRFLWTWQHDFWNKQLSRWVEDKDGCCGCLNWSADDQLKGLSQSTNESPNWKCRQPGYIIWGSLSWKQSTFLKGKKSRWKKSIIKQILVKYLSEINKVLRLSVVRTAQITGFTDEKRHNYW